MALRAVGLCSRALLKLGASGIASFDEGTAESEIATALYASVRDAVLSSHEWNFATAQTTLARLSARPLADYDHAFQLPDDFLRALSLGAGGGAGDSGSTSRGLDYRLSERRLHCNAAPVVLSYIFRADESIFPPFFDQLLIARLAAEFCIPLTDSTARAETLLRLAAANFREARTIDARQSTPPQVRGFSLISARS